MINLYFWPTPNGKKISILLAELNIEFNLIPININKGEQFQEGFLKISPNNKVPAIHLIDNNESIIEPAITRLSLFASAISILFSMADTVGIIPS